MTPTKGKPWRKLCSTGVVRGPPPTPSWFPQYLIVEHFHNRAVLRLSQEPCEDLGAKVAVDQPSTAQLRGPGLVGPEAPHGLREGPAGPWGQPRGTPGIQGTPVSCMAGKASPLVMVVAMSLGVVLTPYVHHHITLGQTLGVPGAHHLCVLRGGGGGGKEK